MSKIIEFNTKCSGCKYEGKYYNCINEKYIKNAIKIVKSGRCPYFERNINNG